MIPDKTLSLVQKSKVGKTDVYETYEGFQIKLSLGMSLRADADLKINVRSSRDTTKVKTLKCEEVHQPGRRYNHKNSVPLSDKISQPLSSVEMLCNQVDEVSRSLRSYAHVHPIFFARIITGMHYLHAKVAGPFMMIWPCEEVSQVPFIGPGECTHNIPISTT